MLCLRQNTQWYIYSQKFLFRCDKNSLNLELPVRNVSSGVTGKRPRNVHHFLLLQSVIPALFWICFSADSFEFGLCAVVQLCTSFSIVVSENDFGALFKLCRFQNRVIWIIRIVRGKLRLAATMAGACRRDIFWRNYMERISWFPRAEGLRKQEILPCNSSETPPYDIKLGVNWCWSLFLPLMCFDTCYVLVRQHFPWLRVISKLLAQKVVENHPTNALTKF